ncbi:transmembrane protein 45B-like [Belonocnema kinseyi]|uniref:transmembrane protein 45B-like n=1 Tax=Belonocnema kinseyi TaxID=2817044 RepID=UPI00143D7085|nr:transmembrane protein 45B-like [Belonocnema kinseyi]XP_033220663.1 transmembrane protein 45B-like [Belonocnema kinseyi]
MQESDAPYLLTGGIFYIFGLLWCFEYAIFWFPPQKEHLDTRDIPRNRGVCNKFLTRYPLEGSLKLISTVIGLAGTLTASPNEGIISAKVRYATLYLFFALSGLVDVLNFYFPRHFSRGLVKMGLAQSFFVEGLLFLWANIGDNPMIDAILAGIVWTTTLSVILELAWPEIKLLTGATTLLHGAWIAHMVRVHSARVLSSEEVVVNFSWHIAVASTVTLCIVGVTRSLTPRVSRDIPPEIPIYDYCQEPGRN